MIAASSAVMSLSMSVCPKGAASQSQLYATTSGKGHVAVAAPFDCHEKYHVLTPSVRPIDQYVNLQSFIQSFSYQSVGQSAIILPAVALSAFQPAQRS